MLNKQNYILKFFIAGFLLIVIFAVDGYTQSLKVSRSDSRGMTINAGFSKAGLTSKLSSLSKSTSSQNGYRLNSFSKKSNIQPEANLKIIEFIGVPFGKTPRLSNVITSASEIVDYRGLPENTASQKYAELKYRGDFRGLPIYSIEISPIVYDRVSYSITEKIEIEITYDDTAGQLNPAKRMRNGWRTFGKTLLNYNEIESLNGNIQTFNFSKKASTAWFDKSKTYYKFTVEEEGLYSLTYDDLLNAGLDPSSILHQNLKLFNKGEEISIAITGPGSSDWAITDEFFSADYKIIFYGDFNRGEKDFYDLYTNKNTYWLVADDTPGKRFTPTVSSSTTQVNSFSFVDTVHFERDDDFFNGGVGLEQTTGTVDGERWVWAKFDSTSKDIPFNFKLSSLSTESTETEFLIAVKGLTGESNSTTIQQELKLTFNDSYIINAKFQSHEDTVLTFQVPAATFIEGYNKLIISKVQAVENKSSLSYMDWFEVIYNRKYEFIEDKLTVDMEQGEAAEISGLTTESIVALDFQNNLIITDLETIQEGSNFKVKISSAGTNRSRYHIYGENAFLKPDFDSKVNFSGLVDVGNKADYIIISHSEFIGKAEEFKNYKLQSNNFPNGIFLVDVEDVYNEFNYGIKSPQAIKGFLTAAKDWVHMPEFVLLVGDASWDHKGDHLESSKIDYLPSYGSPVSDSWYTMVGGEDDLYQDYYIGRLPVSSTKEFDNYFNKLKIYEATQPEEWNKRILFLNGGNNLSQQRILRTTAEAMARDNIQSSPFRGQDIFFNKKSTVAFETKFKEHILAEINKGVLWVNSMGHGAQELYDVDFGTVDDLEESGYFPFMVSMSCNTARFADYKNGSLSESYLLAENKGAIGYFGTTGWGELHNDNDIIKAVVDQAFNYGAASMGEAITIGKNAVYSENVNVLEKNLYLQYSLLGDPSLKLIMPDKPDYKIDANDIVIQTSDLTMSKAPFDIKLYIHNFGLSNEDSIAVSLVDITNDSHPETIQTVKYIDQVGYLDSLTFRWNPSAIGAYKLKAVIDNSGNTAEVSIANNTAVKDVRILEENIVIYKPRGNAFVNTDAVELEVFLPAFEEASTAQFYFEVDTASEFGAPFHQSPPINMNDITTKYILDIPQQFSGRVIHWRVRSNIGGIEAGKWSSSEFYYDRNEVFAEESWIQKSDLFQKGSHLNTEVDDGVLTQAKISIDYSVVSAGFLDGNTSFITMNSRLLDFLHYEEELGEEYMQGIFIAQIDEKNGEQIDGFHFNTHLSSEHSEALAAYINGIPDGRIVLAAVRDEAVNNLTVNAVNALKTFGSQEIDNLEWRDSWSIIGVKGADEPLDEELVEGEIGLGRAEVEYTHQVYSENSKYTSPDIRPASQWTELKYAVGNISSGQSIVVSVDGYNNFQQAWESVYTFAEDELTKELLFINSQTYPALRLNAEILNPERTVPPELEYWQLNYSPGTDFIVDVKSAELSSDSVIQGRKQELELNILRSGKLYVDSVQVSANFIINNSVTSIPISEPIVVFDQNALSMNYSLDIPTSAVIGNAIIELVLDAQNKTFEISEENNKIRYPIYIIKDIEVDSVELFADSKIVRDGDYVKSNPVFVLKVNEKIQLHNVMIKFDGWNITQDAQAKLSLKETANGVDIQYSPNDLEEGEHNIAFSITDDFGNSIEKSLNFKVDSTPRIVNFHPYPNPFKVSTQFAYDLSQDLESVTIKIYTVRGLLIKVITYAPAESGFNYVDWDGMDNDGDHIANGTYICRIIGKVDGRSVTAQTKAVIIR